MWQKASSGDKSKPGKVVQVNKASDSACFHLSTAGGPSHNDVSSQDCCILQCEDSRKVKAEQGYLISTTQFVKELLRPCCVPLNKLKLKHYFAQFKVPHLKTFPSCSDDRSPSPPAACPTRKWSRRVSRTKEGASNGLKPQSIGYQRRKASSKGISAVYLVSGFLNLNLKTYLPIHICEIGVHL